MSGAQTMNARSMLPSFEAVGSFLVGNKTPSDSYFHVRLWLVRGLGLIYLVAFSIIYLQGVALWGTDGLLPIHSYAEAVDRHFGSAASAFWNLPSLFYLDASDRSIRLMGLVGIVLAAVMLLGYANFFILLPLWLMQVVCGLG